MLNTALREETSPSISFGKSGGLASCRPASLQHVLKGTLLLLLSPKLTPHRSPTFKIVTKSSKAHCYCFCCQCWHFTASCSFQHSKKALIGTLLLPLLPVLAPHSHLTGAPTLQQGP
ncbi:unnamed protein product [Ixodes pacificus]